MKHGLINAKAHVLQPPVENIAKICFQLLLLKWQVFLESPHDQVSPTVRLISRVWRGDHRAG